MNRTRYHQNKIMSTERKIGKSGYIYICSLGRDDLYKIGQTSNLSNRLKTLSAANPSLKCIYSAMTTDALGAEKAVHNRYKKCRVEREIFKIKRIDTKGIDKLINKHFKG